MKAFFAALLLTGEAARFKRSATKTIEGVAVHNYKEGAQEWIVLFKKGTSHSTVKSLCNGKCALQGHSVPFATIRGDEETVASVLRGHADVAEIVEPEATDYAIPEIMSNARGLASWGLDAIGVAGRGATGMGVHIYVQDTGVRVTHQDFGGRASLALDMTSGEEVECGSPSASCGTDKQGHGSHCAGTAAGTTFGVAPDASIYSIKTLSDQGEGARSWQMAGIDWAASFGNKPAVLSMSLGGGGQDQGYVASIDTAIDAGVTVVVAAGNSNADTCNFSPAFTPNAITVGATDRNNKRAKYSNWGPCLDIWGPGSDILSVKATGRRPDSSQMTLSGTSMACPHVSGAAALLLEKNPTWKSGEILADMKRTSIKYMISNMMPGDPAEFLWVGSEPAPQYPETPAPTQQLCPDIAANALPDRAGDCSCKMLGKCSMSGGAKWDCVPSSGVPGDWGGRYFLPDCETCKCYDD